MVQIEESGAGRDSPAVSAEDALARRCVDVLWAGDIASQTLGIEIAAITAGRTELKMTVREDMINGHSLCHGGLIFMLADTALAFACNSRNESSVPMNCSIDFIRPALIGDVLTVVAEERSMTRRVSVLDATVCNQDGKVIAHMRGRSSNLGRPLVEE